MENNENKTAPEELTDEALDEVAGGKSVVIQNAPAVGVRHGNRAPAVGTPHVLSQDEISDLVAGDKSGQGKPRLTNL